jgi:transcriptional adapter 3
MQPLGRHYTEIWAEEDGIFYGKTDGSPITKVTPRKVGKGSEDIVTSETDSKLEIKKRVPYTERTISEEAYCQPLTERILAALIDENLIIKDEIDADDSDIGRPIGKERTRAEMMELEERIIRELRYTGLLEENEEVDWFARTDDEISAELRYLQKQLREQHIINNERGKCVLAVVKPYMGLQEYRQLLSELDKQIEQAFVKRYVCFNISNIITELSIINLEKNFFFFYF